MKKIRIKRTVTVHECDVIGIPFSGVPGALCQVDHVSSVRQGYEDINGPCEAYHVEILTGPHNGSQWWIPKSFVTSACMFGGAS